MSSSEPPPSDTSGLVLSGAVPGTWIEVFDAQFRSVGAGWDYLNLKLPEGVYEARATAGGARESQLLAIKPGVEIRREMVVKFPAAAPSADGSASAQQHSDFAEWLSGEFIHSDSEAPAALSLVLRNIDDGPKLRIDTVELLDSHLKPVLDAWEPPWFLGGNDIAGKAVGLAPGPYVLRTYHASGSHAVASTDQTIWLSPGWQTHAFLPNQELGADSGGMSVHMSPMTRAWHSDTRDGLVLEAVMGQLHAGESDVAPSVIKLAGDTCATNPMLAIAALQLLAPGIQQRDDVQELIDELQHQVGPHPDVLALNPTLRYGADYAFAVSWPPMFDLSYRKFLLAADQLNIAAIGEDSPAERVAPFLHHTGPWLRWETTEAILSDDALTTPTEAWANSRWRWEIERRGPVSFNAMRQVESGIGEIAAFRHVELADVVDDLGVARLAELLHLPTALVRSAITDMGIPTRQLVRV
ncbi:hypothetical protein [Mycolicibacterium fortuitum]|uniref:hypothetical protein n=1 Tax=Mycolicibacterium fortuitum TaxID=1766 RepID=UPI0010426702|nr:hypothetical protein [Mycolicibacterium fortuitum]